MSEPCRSRDDPLARWLLDVLADGAGTATDPPVDLDLDLDADRLTDERAARILRKAAGALAVGDPPRYLPAQDLRLAPPVARRRRRPAALLAVALVAGLGGAAYLATMAVAPRPDDRPAVPTIPAPAPAPAAPTEWIVDDLGPGYSETGTGWTSAATAAVGGSHRYNTGGSIAARWTVADLPPGRSEVFVTWSPHPNRAYSVPFTVLDGDEPLATVHLDQSRPPDDLDADGAFWERLGTFTITDGPLTVVLDATNARVDRSATIGNSCSADAVRVVPLGP